MFDPKVFDSLESAPRGRRWTTALSFLLQSGAVVALLLIPLLYTEALPSLFYTEHLTVPVGRSAPDRPMELVDTKSRPHTGSQIANGKLMLPGPMPQNSIQIIDPPDFNAGTATGGPYIPGATGNDANGSINKLLANANPGPPPPPLVRREPLRVSNLDQGALVQRVQPVYPPAARAARIQGPVVMTALIDGEGRIANLRLVSGNPLLVNAAMDAVRQWRYRPYMLNGRAIEVETQITVVFSLNN